jgi:hypothetical protein
MGLWFHGGKKSTLSWSDVLGSEDMPLSKAGKNLSVLN